MGFGVGIFHKETQRSHEGTQRKVIKLLRIFEIFCETLCN